MVVLHANFYILERDVEFLKGGISQTYHEMVPKHSEIFRTLGSELF